MVALCRSQFPRRNGSYAPFHYDEPLSSAEIDLSDEMFIIKQETAEAYLARAKAPQVLKENGEPWSSPSEGSNTPAQSNVGAQASSNPLAGQATFDLGTPPAAAAPPNNGATTTAAPPAALGIHQARWQGEVPPQKWMTFYTRVLSRFAANRGDPPGRRRIARDKLSASR